MENQPTKINVIFKIIKSILLFIALIFICAQFFSILPKGIPESQYAKESGASSEVIYKMRKEEGDTRAKKNLIGGITLASLIVFVWRKIDKRYLEKKD